MIKKLLGKRSASTLEVKIKFVRNSKTFFKYIYITQRGRAVECNELVESFKITQQGFCEFDVWMNVFDLVCAVAMNAKARMVRS